MSNANVAAIAAALYPWHLIYLAADAKYQEIFRCQATDAEHAIEQLHDAEPGACVLSVVRMDSTVITQERDVDFVLAAGSSCWITSHNASVHIFDRDGTLKVNVMPYGCEMSDGRSVAVDYTDLAWDALLADGEAPNQILECTAALQDAHLIAHLAALDEAGREKVRAALGYAILVPTGDLNVDPGSAIVAPLPLDASSGRLLIHYESNRYGAENMRRFVEKLYNAADRAETRYPTIAKSLVGLHEVQVVGRFSHAERRIVELYEPAALLQWAGTIGDTTL